MNAILMSNNCTSLYIQASMYDNGFMIIIIIIIMLNALQFLKLFCIRVVWQAMFQIRVLAKSRPVTAQGNQPKKFTYHFSIIKLQMCLLFAVSL